MGFYLLVVDYTPKLDSAVLGALTVLYANDHDATEVAYIGDTEKTRRAVASKKPFEVRLHDERTGAPGTQIAKITVGDIFALLGSAEAWQRRPGLIYITRNVAAKGRIQYCWTVKSNGKLQSM